MGGGSGEGPDIGKLMGVHRHTRVSSLATESMLRNALDEAFGAEAGGWHPNTIAKMFAAINRDLRAGLKANYDSPEGLFALLLQCSKEGGRGAPWRA